MLYKSKQVEDELWRSEPGLIALAFYADTWALREFGHQLLVTDVSRLQAEYDAIYPSAIARGTYWMDAGGVKHYAGPMPHLEDPVRKLRCRAIDWGMRWGPHIAVVERLDDVEARRLAEHLCASFPRRDGKPTAMVHDVGSGPHVHGQWEVWRA